MKNESQLEMFDNSTIQIHGNNTRKSSKYQPGKLFSINISAISENTSSSRSFLSEEKTAALAESIKVKGLLQPVVCILSNDEQLVLAAGTRRLRAAKQAGFNKIPCWIVNGDPDEISLIENLFRDDLTTVEEAEAIANLKIKRGYRLDDLSTILNKAVSTISEILAVSSLPQVIRDDCRSNSSISRDILVHISRLASDDEKLVHYEDFKAGKSSRSDVMSVKRRSNGHKKSSHAFITNFTNRIKKIDFNNLASSECDEMRAEMEELHKTTGEMLIKLAVNSEQNFGTPKIASDSAKIK
jgi:ParB family chromosome partitioning protein